MKTSALQFVTTRRQAIIEVRAIANAVIEQNERWARGFDRDLWRDDVPTYARAWTPTVREIVRNNVRDAFQIAQEWTPREWPCCVCGKAMNDNTCGC